MIRGEVVSLRRFRAEDVDRVHAFAHEDVGGRSWWPGNPSRREVARRIAASEVPGEQRLDLAIEVDGRLVGEVNARSPRDAFPEGVYEFGIAVYGDDRGRGYATEAVRLLLRRLFDELGAARVQCSTDVENVGMRTVAERAGLVGEGVLRGYMPAGRGRRDYVLYGITRSDWNGGTWT